MYCPNCRAEYREGFFKCADCHVPLVAGLPPENDKDDVHYVDMVEVYSTYNPADIVFIKSLLDGEGIHYYFQGENSMVMIAAGAYARLLVQADQAERVREIIKTVF
jgi:hypothetical protein